MTPSTYTPAYIHSLDHGTPGAAEGPSAEALEAAYRFLMEVSRDVDANLVALDDVLDDLVEEVTMTRKGSGGGKHQEPAAVQKERTKCPLCRGQRGHKCNLCGGTGWIE